MTPNERDAAIHDAIRKAGGIVHSDGNIFFTNAEKFLAAAAVSPVAASSALGTEPVDMVLYCPNCGMQHVDAPDRLEDIVHAQSGTVVDQQWSNPPHRSHLCHGCKTVWRPADVPTNGVAELKTKGKADTWPVHNEEVSAMPAVGAALGTEGVRKLWLWENFVDGKPEYWAFDNAFPINLEDCDPQTLGEPCGYAIFKPSRVGRTDVSEPEVLRRVRAAGAVAAPAAHLGWLYDWIHSSALGKPDEHFTGFTTDEAHAKKHDNARPVYGQAVAAPAVEPVAWRCFHCEEVFTEAAAARAHFGDSEYQQAICTIAPEHFRWMEAQHRRNVDDDTEALRTIRGLVGEHEALRRRAAEEGYARGLADAKKHPAELGLMPATSPQGGISSCTSPANTFCWLVELRPAFDGHPPFPATYYGGFCTGSGDPFKTLDPRAAARFSRKEDAERVALNLLNTLSCKWEAVEHGFAAPPPPEVPASGGWMPIKDAPRDGTDVLLRFGSDGVSQGHYVPGLPHPWKFIDTNDGITWLINHAVDGPGGPSHYMPMPPGSLSASTQPDAGGA